MSYCAYFKDLTSSNPIMYEIEIARRRFVKSVSFNVPQFNGPNSTFDTFTSEPMEVEEILGKVFSIILDNSKEGQKSNTIFFVYTHSSGKIAIMEVDSTYKDILCKAPEIAETPMNPRELQTFLRFYGG